MIKTSTQEKMQSSSVPSFNEDRYEDSTMVTSTPKKHSSFIDRSYMASLSPIRAHVIRPEILEYNRFEINVAEGYRHNYFEVEKKEMCQINFIYDLEMENEEAAESRRPTQLSNPKKETLVRVRVETSSQQITPGSRRSGRKRVAAMKTCCC